jgi:transcription elongation factor Elf1
MSIIEFIRDRAKYYNCPVCGRNLRGCGVRMLNQVEDRYTVQVSCASCGVNFVIVLMIQGVSLEAEGADVELVADFEDEEPEGTVPADPIAADEMLDLHEMLKEFRGPLTDLLRAPDRTPG